MKERLKQLRIDTYALYLAYRDPRVPFRAKLLIAAVVGYALSPIDLIPDFIPILGQLDDLIIVPAGIALALRMMPPEILEEYREKAKSGISNNKRKNWIAAAIIVLIWLLAAYLFFTFLLKIFS